MTETKSTKNSPLRLPADLRTELQREIGARMMRGEKATYGSLLREAWYRSKDQETAAIPESDKTELHPAHEMLQFILDHGTEKDIEWITGNLRNFGEAIQSRKPLPRNARKAG